METKVELLEGDRAKISVTVDADVVTDRIKKQYKQAANQYNIPGFRKGKAPRPVIDSALGKDYIRAVVTDNIVNENYPMAIDESGIFPVGQADFGEEELGLVEDGKPYTFVFEIGTKPKFELSSYDPVEIEMPADHATDEQVDAEIDALLEHYQDIVDAPANTKVKADKYVDLKIAATDDNGEDIAAISNESMQYKVGSGLLPSTFDDEIIGLKKGETKQFSIDTPTTPTALTTAVMGKTAQINFDVEVLAVKKEKVPALTDEWVQEKIGLNTVEELRNEVSEEIESTLSSALPRMKESRVLEKLAERLEGEVPEGLVEDNETTLLQDFFNQLQRGGMTLDMYLQQQGITSGQFRDDVKQQATDMTKQDLALDAYAAHAKLEATDEDVRAEFEQAGASDPEALMAEWRKNGQMYLVRQGILRQKAAKELVDNAIVTEEKPEEKKAGKHSKEEEAE
ncbi:MAG: trigger factor [Eggerthellaceae bacterium]|nr:trigger factor [Eggerthellaceae bacterium]